MFKPPLTMAFNHKGMAKQLILNQMDYSPETNQKIQTAVSMMSKQQADQGLQILSQLQSQKKILFNTQMGPMENAEQNTQNPNFESETKN